MANSSGHDEAFGKGYLNDDSLKERLSERIVFFISFQVVCTAFGIPLNVFIAFLILRLKQLRRKPHNIFLLGIVISNLSVFAPSLIDILHFLLPYDDLLCRISVAVTGLPDVFLLLSILISLVNR